MAALPEFLREVREAELLMCVCLTNGDVFSPVFLEGELEDISGLVAKLQGQDSLATLLRGSMPLAANLEILQNFDPDRPEDPGFNPILVKTLNNWIRETPSAQSGLAAHELAKDEDALESELRKRRDLESLLGDTISKYSRNVRKIETTPGTTEKARAEHLYGTRTILERFSSGDPYYLDYPTLSSFEAWLARLANAADNTTEFEAAVLSKLESYRNSALLWSVPGQQAVNRNILLNPHRVLAFLKYLQELIDGSLRVTVRHARSVGRWGPESSVAIDPHVILRVERKNGDFIPRDTLLRIGLAACVLLCQDSVSFRVRKEKILRYTTFLIEEPSNDRRYSYASIRTWSRYFARRLTDTDGSVQMTSALLPNEITQASFDDGQWTNWINSATTEQILIFSMKHENDATSLLAQASEAFKNNGAGFPTIEYRTPRDAVENEQSHRLMFRLYHGSSTTRLLLELLLAKLKERNRKTPNLFVPIAYWSLQAPESDLPRGGPVDGLLKVSAGIFEGNTFNGKGNCHCGLCLTLPVTLECFNEGAATERGLICRVAQRVKDSISHHYRVDTTCGCGPTNNGWFFCPEYWLPVYRTDESAALSPQNWIRDAWKVKDLFPGQE